MPYWIRYIRRTNTSMLIHFMTLCLKANIGVSRATIYNTVDLLVDAGLIRKHQFGYNPAQYEKSYNMVSHHHLICTKCGKVQEVKDQELLNVLANKKFGKFTTSYYALYVYGLCNRCNQAERKKSIS